MQAHEGSIELHDGRMIGYAEYGVYNAGDTPALLYFHGHPGSRVEAELLAKSAQHLGLRLIGLDRPGMGRSYFQADRRLLDWPLDVVEVADRLHLDRFAVIGFSGGGPYALACAYRIPHRLTACGIVSGVGETNELRLFLSLWLPYLLLPLIRRSLREEEQARKYLVRAARRWVEADRHSLLVSGIAECFSASLVEALRHGARGAAYDGMLIGGGRPWGFRLEDIPFPRIFLWHGDLDQNVPLARGRAVAERLAHCTATYFSNEGHLSLIVNHREEMVTRLIL